MTGKRMDSPTADSTPYQVPRRDRLFAVLTANVAVAFALAGWYEAEKRVLPVNSARLLEIHMLQTEMRIKAASRSSREGLSRPATKSADGNSETADEPEDIEKRIAALTEQMATTAIIAYVWKYLMFLTAAILEMAALLSTTRRRRGAHLVAAWAVLISTACTLIAMRLLVSPSFGGMESLSIRSYLYIATIQGSYGALLLAVFLKKPRISPG